MRNILVKNFIFIFFTVLFLGFLFVSTVSAVVVDNLVIEFENKPLFSEVNFIPGDGVDRWIKVINNSQNTQGIFIEAINFSNPGELGDDLKITIKEGLTELYSDTMTNFFSYGKVFLSNLTGNGGSAQYNLNIRFPKGVDSSSMQDSIVFDILIGFSGESGGSGSGEDNEIVISGGNGGFGGSGNSQGTSGYRGLVISNEAVFNIISEAGMAEIFWNTSYAATSQVVYGLVSEGPYVLDLNDSKFGYPFATLEKSTKVTEHYVNLSGLIPGETYNYRVISHASPATVSFEHTFVVPLSENINTQDVNTSDDTDKEIRGSQVQNESKKESLNNIVVLNNNPVVTLNNPVFFDTAIKEDEGVAVLGEKSSDKPVVSGKKNSNGLASAFSAFSFDDLFSSECINYTAYLFFIFVVAYILRSLWERKNKDFSLSKRELLSKRILYFIKLIIGLLILIFIFQIICSSSLLLLILIFLVIWYFLNKRKKN